MQLQDDTFQALINELEASFAERVDSRKKELAAEIASIQTAKPSYDDIVFELALARLKIRRLKGIVGSLESTRKKQLENIKLLASNSDRRIDSQRKQLKKLDDRIREVVALLPRAYEEGKKTIAVRGAAARHAPTRDAKRTVFDHLDKNPPKPRGKDSAALAMAETLVSEKFRTVRRWIDEWEKLRVTGKE